MGTLPIPDVVEIREVHAPSVHWFAFIAPDYMAGLKHRYSVVRVERKTGVATCIGHELPLKLARKVAKEACKRCNGSGEVLCGDQFYRDCPECAR